jgi:hypothetical protein
MKEHPKFSEWAAFGGGVYIKNTRQLHAIPTNRFSIPNAQKQTPKCPIIQVNG